MKILFFGSGSFAVRLLEALPAQDVSLVVTQPDRKKGRHLRLRPTPVKEFALAHRMGLFQPESVNDNASLERLKSEEADLFLVVSYGQIFCRELLALPRRMCLNVHASLLPKYRGAGPVQHSLINGERLTGVSFIKMNEHMDRGDILFKKTVPIRPEDTHVNLEQRLADVAADVLPQVLKKIEEGRFALVKQDGRKASYAPLITKQDGLIRWYATASEVFNRFRGCFGWPGSFTTYNGKLLKVLAMAPGRSAVTGRPGEILRAAGDVLEVACARGTIYIREVLPEAHNRMPVQSFLAGHKVKVGDVLGS